jgi:hypothetical protein
MQKTVAPLDPRANLPLLDVAGALDESAWLARGVSREDCELIRRCVAWTTTYPLQRVRKRRRVEAICPMLAPALSAGGMVFSVASGEGREPSLERLDELLREAAEVFETRVPCDDPRLRCLVLILPGVRGGRLLEATDPARGIKNELLRRGILAGEFFPTCPFATTFNPRLFALRSPAPMYVLRTFLESDWRFICQIPAWQQTYRERFGEPPARMRHLGGRWWRLKQKVLWRIHALNGRFRPDPGSTAALDA